LLSKEDNALEILFIVFTNFQVSNETTTVIKRNAQCYTDDRSNEQRDSG
jgi:hypothetical protein